MGLLSESTTSTVIGCVRGMPAGPTWALPETRTSVLAGPIVPVSVKRTGEPRSPFTVAETVLTPGTLPSWRVIDDWPLAPVLTVLAETVPPPERTCQPTGMFETG